MATRYNAATPTIKIGSGISGDIYLADVFTNSIEHSTTSVKLKVYQYQTPPVVGTLIVSIREATDTYSNDGMPTGPDLGYGELEINTLGGSTPVEGVEIVFSSPCLLRAGANYATVYRTVGGSCRIAGSYSMYPWFKNRGRRSLDAGETWTIPEVDNKPIGWWFEEWGDIVVAPTVTTQEMTDVEAATATGNGNATDLGGESLTQHGNCWSTSPNPTTSDDKTTLGTKSETGAFTSSLTELSPNTLYYCRAYATNSAGTSYGNEVTFTTLVASPEVTTNEESAISQMMATLNGTLTDDGGKDCDVRFQWGKTSEYGIDTNWQSGKESVIAFEQAIGGLYPGFVYHFRAQAKNSAGTVNGADRSFTSTPLLSRGFALSRQEL